MLCARAFAAGENARAQNRVEALFDTGYIFLRHRATHGDILEHKARTRLEWLEIDDDARELA